MRWMVNRGEVSLCTCRQSWAVQLGTQLIPLVHAIAHSQILHTVSYCTQLHTVRDNWAKLHTISDNRTKLHKIAQSHTILCSSTQYSEQSGKLHTQHLFKYIKTCMLRVLYSFTKWHKIRNEFTQVKSSGGYGSAVQLRVSLNCDYLQWANRNIDCKQCVVTRYSAWQFFYYPMSLNLR